MSLINDLKTNTSFHNYIITMYKIAIINDKFKGTYEEYLEELLRNLMLKQYKEEDDLK